jgi:hypothetical protein
MSQPKFQEMSQKELRDYTLSHRDDQEAFYSYIDRLHQEGNWIEMPPVDSLVLASAARSLALYP